jgi:hypothetical protein
VNLLCAEGYDEYRDIDLREEFGGDNVDPSDIENISIRSQSHLLRRFKTRLPHGKRLSLAKAGTKAYRL